MYCYVLQMCSLARAKYDNLAESPDELAFRRGDVLTVIDQVIRLLSSYVCLQTCSASAALLSKYYVTILRSLCQTNLKYCKQPRSYIILVCPNHLELDHLMREYGKPGF